MLMPLLTTIGQVITTNQQGTTGQIHQAMIQAVLNGMERPRQKGKGLRPERWCRGVGVSTAAAGIGERNENETAPSQSGDPFLSMRGKVYGGGQCSQGQDHVQGQLMTDGMQPRGGADTGRRHHTEQW